MASATSFHTALRGRGFERGTGGVYRDSPEVRAICSAGVSRKNTLASVSFGLWIFELSDVPPETYNKCHIYGSLGSIHPRFKNLRIVAGAADDDAWRELVDCAGAIADEIDSLLTVGNIVRAFAQGRFAGCLIRKEARAFLTARSS